MKTFDSWGSAERAGLYARGLWRDRGYQVKKGEPAEGSLENPEVSNRRIPLFRVGQVRELNEPQKSKRILIGQFLSRQEYFVAREHHTGQIGQYHTDTVQKSLKELVYSTWLYKNRTTGVRVPFLWNPAFRSEGFDFRAGETTRYVVLDLDNHLPTLGSTEAHLLLLRRLVDLLPRLIRCLGGARVFFDYRQDVPQGIHIWIWFPYPRKTKDIHRRLRMFLKSNSDAELDMKLQRNGLLDMGSVEILPSETHCMRFFGTYDRRVFTTVELKPKNESFDAGALLQHLTHGVGIGNPCVRYGELSRAGLALKTQVAVPSVPICPRTQEVTTKRPQRKGNYFAYLIDACLNGVSTPDLLYGSYLVPIATALYFREFHDHPKRNEKVVSTLMEWLETKNNGLVSRVSNGQKESLKRGIRGIVRKMPKSAEKIQRYWASVARRDLAYPDLKISLVKAMEITPDNPLTVTKGNLPEVRSLLERKIVPISPAVTINLPGTVESHLREHLGRAGTAPGACTDRIIKFAERLLQEVGLDGHRRISSARINQLAGLGKGRKTAVKYKKLLAGAGILELGWDRALRVGTRCSLYRLTDWALDEMRRTCHAGSDNSGGVSTVLYGPVHSSLTQ